MSQNGPAYYVDLERRLLQVLNNVAGQIGSPAVEVLERMIDLAGEHAVALDIICDGLVESGGPVDADTLAAITQLVDMMETDRTCLNKLTAYAAEAQSERDGP